MYIPESMKGHIGKVSQPTLTTRKRTLYGTRSIKIPYYVSEELVSLITYALFTTPMVIDFRYYIKQYSLPLCQL